MTAKLPDVTSCLRLCSPLPVADAGILYADMALLHARAAEKVMRQGIKGSEIEALTLHNTSCVERSAFNRLSDLFQSLLPPLVKQRQIKEGLQEPELIFCRWAAPHTDNMFDQELFISLVLGTGPSSYRVESLMPTLSVNPTRGQPPSVKVSRHSLNLVPGMVFLLDPLMPHYASPESPHQDSLLTLMQFRLPYLNRRERQHWIRLLASNGLQRQAKAVVQD